MALKFFLFALSLVTFQNETFLLSYGYEKTLGRQGSSSMEHGKSLIDMLMESAKPLHLYNIETVSQGGSPILTAKEPQSRRLLPEFMSHRTNDERRRLADDYYKKNDDDANKNDADDDAYTYYLDDGIVRDFSGYSFKYNKCQPIQRFSQEAASNGEYSALITDFMVVFRFCPSRRCSSSKTWGCDAGYGEYVIKLSHYLRAMMYYQYENKSNMCSFCESCDFNDDYFNRRRLGNNGDDDNNGGDDYYKGGDDGDDYYAKNDDNNDVNDDTDDNTDDYTQKSYSSECVSYDFMCKHSKEVCAYGGDDDANPYKDSLDYLDYLDYLDCVAVMQDDRNMGYWIAPRCDIYGKITMSIFYDPYCSQYAGNEVNIKEVTGISFSNSVFEYTYEGNCQSCSSNAGAPFYGKTHNFCNKVYNDAGKCNQYLAYKVDDDDYNSNSYSSASEVSCAYIENIRYGVYDTQGQIYVGTAAQNETMGDGKVTVDQKVMIILIGLTCISLSLYSCFLHHEITNLLLHKLSYQGGLGPRSLFSRRKKDNKSANQKREDDFSYFSYASDSAYSYA